MTASMRMDGAFVITARPVFKPFLHDTANLENIFRVAALRCRMK
jgi:hypothetical protein